MRRTNGTAVLLELEELLDIIEELSDDDISSSIDLLLEMLEIVLIAYGS